MTRSSPTSRLGPIPHRYNLAPVRIGLWHKDVQELVVGKVNETYATPYVMCAMSCIGAVLEVIGPTDEIIFIFDRQEGKRAATMEILHKVVFEIAKLDRRVKDIDFRPRKTTVCLDPSDYLACGFRENMVDKDPPRAKACLPIGECEKFHGGILAREQIQSMADHFIEYGMVPGSKQRKLSPNLISALLKAGWSQASIAGFNEYIENRNRTGAWA